VLVGELPDHAGRGEECVCGGGASTPAGVVDEGVPERGEQDSVGPQHLGQRHALLGPAVAGFLGGGEVARGARVGDGGDDEPQVVLDGAPQVVTRHRVIGAVQLDLLEDPRERVVGETG
jgi:hypothetical protein